MELEQMKKVNSCNGKAFQRRSGALQSYSDAQKSQALKMLKMLATYHTPTSLSTKQAVSQSPGAAHFGISIVSIITVLLVFRLDFYCFHHYGSRRVSVLLGGWSAVVLSRLRSLDLGFNHRDTNGGTGECPFNRLPSTYLAIARASLAPQNITVTKMPLYILGPLVFSLGVM